MYCEDCAIRLFNVKQYNLKGVGNPFYGRCIVVPNVDYTAYKKGSMTFSEQVEVIKSVLSSTGERDDVYIVPLIRCNEKIACKLDRHSYNKCINWFAEDVRKYNFQDILLLGDAARRFLNCNINEHLDSLLISSNNRKYFVSYSPLIKYNDESKYEVFKSNLLRWYYAATNNDYSSYNIMKI